MNDPSKTAEVYGIFCYQVIFNNILITQFVGG
jgi:hypothetical protein